MSATDTASSRMPRQIPYIIGNEGCERFSFYGMRNILVQFLITSLLLQHITAGSERELAAKRFDAYLHDRRVFLPPARRLSG